MNREPKFPANEDAPVSSREESTAECVISTIVTFILMVGIRRLFRWSLAWSDILEAALFSLFVNFGYQALVQYIERRKTTLLHKTLPLP
jgi:hypothetical protein